MHKLAFRFDIDTHKCIRDGVQNLVQLAEKEQVRFSFYLNLGRAVSFKESLREFFLPVDTMEDIQMLSARQKLGFKDYCIAAVINPRLTFYKKQILMLYNSNNELGIHGGKNHALWHKYAADWEEEKLESEIIWAINKIRKMIPDYELKGFASPGWTSPSKLEGILIKYGFSYCADYHCLGERNVIRGGKLPYVGVNLLGEPGGVAFFENCRVKGMNTNQIVDVVLESIDKNEHTVIYDHPYYAGIQEIGCLSEIIEKAKKRDDVEIVSLEKLF